MYFVAVVLLLFVLPAASVVLDALWFSGSADLMALTGKWFTFFAVGVRLFTAGLSQIYRPQYTSDTILGLKDSGANIVVRELGFANVSIGALGLLSLAFPAWTVPAAIAGGLFYGLAGLGHVFKSERNVKEQAALISDLAMFVLLAAFIVSRVV
jgi:hypothetical protein